MAVLEIKKIPEKVLRSRAEEVKSINGEIASLAQDMLETMYDAPGIGLAAPQVGKPIRLIVFDIWHPEDEPNPHVLINPVITAKEGLDVMEEGCLSVPGVRAEVKRSYRVEVKGYDLNEKEVVLEAEGLLARVLQHEIDHLDGVLFIDRLSRVKRELIKKRLRRMR